MNSIINFLMKTLSSKLSLLFASFTLACSGSNIIVVFINYILEIFDMPIIPYNDSVDYIMVSIFVCLTFLFYLLHLFEKNKINYSEFIAIRHNSIGSFKKEAIKDERSIIESFLRYREINLDLSHRPLKTIEDALFHIKETENVKIKLTAFKDVNHKCKIGYYGLSYIPFSFYLGFLLFDNSQKIKVFELNNSKNKWNNIKSGKSKKVIKFCVDSDISKRNELNNEVILKFEISSLITNKQIEKTLHSNNCRIFKIGVDKPEENNIKKSSEILEIEEKFMHFLSYIKENHSETKKIHIFYAGPNSLAFSLGRKINSIKSPEIIVYNYDPKKSIEYSWSLSFNNDKKECLYNEYGD